MPLIAAAFVAHAVGLLLGFGGVSFAAAVAAGIVTVAAALRRDARLAALALLAAGGVLRATVARRADAACVRRATPGGSERPRSAPRDPPLVPDHAGGATYRAVVESDASPGHRVMAVLHDGGCRLRASILIERGSAPAGAEVVVRGAPARAGTLIVLQHATVAALAPPSIARRWRESAGRAVDRTFAGDAPLARALLIADTRTLDAGIRARYADAGIVHLLSVSGLHVAIIAGAVEMLLGAVRVARGAAAWLSLIVTAVYVVVIGAPAPAVRAAVMLGAGAISRLTQRPTSPWASLALGAWVPLVEPRTIIDLGYQLSVTGLAALIASGAVARRTLAGRVSGWRRALVRDLMASSLASLVTLPLIAWTFGRVSVVAPLTNLAAGPIFGILQPTLFLALAFSPVRGAATLPADASHALLATVDAIAGVATRLPAAAIPVAPTLWTAVLLAVISAALVVACASNPRGAWAPRSLIVGAMAAALLALGVEHTGASGIVELHTIDVGQGDAVALRTPRGRWILFDAGRSWSGGDAGRSVVVPYLRRRGGDLHAFVLSHPHSDHVGGAATVVASLRPLEYWDGAYVAGSEPYRASLEAAARGHIAWRRVHPADSIAIDGVRIRFVAPDSTWTASLDDANEASAVALVQYGDVRFLLTGDAESAEEEWMVRRYGAQLRADVLKVGHHGSATSSTPPFLDAVAPKVALISVGAGNSYGHPSSAVIAALRERGASVMRTDQLGSVVVRTDGRFLRVDAAGEQWGR